MRKLYVLFTVVWAFLTVGPAWAQGGCSAYNEFFGPVLYSGPPGLKEHVTGFHTWGASYGSACYYFGAAGTCGIDATATVSPYTLSEQGKLSTIIDVHDGNYSFKSGAHSSTGSAVSADDEGAAAFRSCLGSCGVSIGISGSGEGTGFTVSFPADNIYADDHHDAVTCDPRSAPPLCHLQICPGREVWNPETCECEYVSPIIIDTNGHGFHFTDPKSQCVTFNWGGKMLCTSWPEQGSGNAWLVYDRDNDGKVDSADELFGDFTPHSNGDYLPTNLPRPNPANGFMALAFYDQPAQGGNQDMQITAQDRIWPQLRLWIDEHCQQTAGPCSALPKELHRPEEFGIHSFSVLYGPSEKKDQWGNWFRLYAQANPKPHDLKKPDDELKEMRMYDVFVVKQ